MFTASNIPLKGMAGTKESLKGVIRDAVFNGRLLKLNEPVSFEGVGIGRESDVFYSTNGYDLSGERMESMPAQIFETCAELPQYSLEPRAVKIGDAQYSHITLNVERKKFARDFRLTFEFRTYYPNGLFFLIRGNNRRIKFHLSLALKGGYVVADLLEKKRIELVSINKHPLNDGLWHNITIIKQDKVLKLKVDDNKVVEIERVRRKLPLRSPIYIGGIPEGLNNIDDNLIQESFKGCIKNFHIGHQYIDLASGMLHNISECFSKIEKGAYFAGDGYAIFGNHKMICLMPNRLIFFFKNLILFLDDNFNLGYKSDIELEFKTTRLNGILLSIANGSDFEAPSLSVELHNGQIIASVDIGNGPFRAVKAFDSKYDMCDGRWHVVKLQYAKSSVTLKVDKYEAVYGLSEKESHKIDSFTQSPLYIGGLPGKNPII